MSYTSSGKLDRQNINSSQKVLHIQFEGQYLPQYNVAFAVTGLILLWKLGYPAFNIIGVHFQWDEY